MTRRRGLELGTRGRVPFALVGVLLVVTSALFASGIDTPQPTPEPAVDLAVERTTADARAAFRTAVADASVDAASDPAVVPANTRWGDALDTDEPFRDALRARIYVAARERFGSITRTHRGVRANVSLAETPTPDALARATERVDIEQVGDEGTRLRAEISNATVTATRGGRVVGRRNVSLSVVVETPVLAVHERVETYQKRLKAGIAKPGLGQRLTTRLYAVAWARGYAQYGGAPISNVVGNRHVELLTNGAVLDVQRSTFGRSDPDGRRSLLRATAAVGLTDVVSANGPADPAANKLLQQQLRSAGTPRENAGVPGLANESTGAPAPNETTNVSVGLSADTAFRELLRERLINRTIQSVYSAQVRTVAATERTGGGKPARPDSPDGDWEVQSDSIHTTVKSVSNTSLGPTVDIGEPYHRLHTYERLVTLHHERRTVWRRGTTTRVTTETSTEHKRVTVVVAGWHAFSEYAPNGSIRMVHERGGPFDGPNLADIPRRAREQVVAQAGGPDALAGRAARGALDTNPRTVTGEWPANLSRSVYPGLVELRRTVRNESIAVSRGRLGTHEVNPARKLHERLLAREAALVGAPNTYRSVSEKARAAVRGRYVALVLARLERRADQHAKREAALGDALKNVGGPSLSTLRASYDAGRADERGELPDDDLELHVDGAPPYLTLGEISHEQVAAVEPDRKVHPLTARNVNYFSIPYGDATNAALTALLPGGSSRKRKLVTAAKTLRAANRTLEHRPNATVAERRDRLRRQVVSTERVIRFRLRTELAFRGVGDSDAARRRILDEALSEWETADARALALANGSAVEPIVDAAVAEMGDSLSPRRRDRIRLDVRTGLYLTLQSKQGKVSGPSVTATHEYVKAAVKERLQQEMSDLAQKKFNRSIKEIPAGFPLSPVPGNWYVTMNVWSVTVRGEYARFAVETPRRTPAADDASLSYVRDGENATFDVDGDGDGEVVGRSKRVTFTSRTAVVVVVPAGKTGVGDIDGTMIETSPGWPIPGATDRTTPWSGERYPLSVGEGDDCTDGPANYPPRSGVSPPGEESGECSPESDTDL